MRQKGRSCEMWFTDYTRMGIMNSHMHTQKSESASAKFCLSRMNHYRLVCVCISISADGCAWMYGWYCIHVAQRVNTGNLLTIPRFLIEDTSLAVNEGCTVRLGQLITNLFGFNPTQGCGSAVMRTLASIHDGRGGWRQSMTASRGFVAKKAATASWRSRCEYGDQS